MTVENTEAAERWAQAPRPLQFVRIRLHRGGQAEYIRDLFEDEKEELLTELGELRGQGVSEGDPKVEEVRTNLRHLIAAIKDISMGIIELSGPDGY